MTVYYVDDGGSATAPYDTWAKAATSLEALDDAVTLASGDIVYVGHNHVDGYSISANRTITGPVSGQPTYIISATQGSDPPTYQASTTNQVDTSAGAYYLQFDGSFALYGIRIKTGAEVRNTNDSNEVFLCYSCTFAPGANEEAYLNNAAGARAELINCTYDLTADGTTGRTTAVFDSGQGGSRISIIGGTFTNPGYRTGSIFGSISSSAWYVSGLDMSGFSNATECELTQGGVNLNTVYLFTNCKTKASPTYVATVTAGYTGRNEFYNTGSADAPTALVVVDGYGTLTSSTSVYRSSGASVESTSTAWLVTTTAECKEGSPFWTPWMYGTISSTGSKTFTVYIVNDAADLTDAECWLEVQYMGTSNEPQFTLATDQRASMTASAANQADDAGSTWNGTGPSFTYKQSLAVTATVNEDGIYRARVAVAKASIAAGDDFYIDPKVTVAAA